MTEATTSRKGSEVAINHGQTLFMTAAPVIRYPIAAALAAAGAYMFLHSPPFDMSYAVIYGLVASIYARELVGGVAVMAVLIGLFKVLAGLPMLAAILVVVVACAFIGF